MATVQDLKKHYPTYWRVGTGHYVIVCESSERLTFFQTLESARAAKLCSCGLGCNHDTSPHRGIKLEDAPGQKISKSWKAMVDAA